MHIHHHDTSSGPLKSSPDVNCVVAVTGATGFVGKAFIWKALINGNRIRALTRTHQPPMEGVEWIVGTLEDPAALAELCQGADAVVHIAGAIKAKNREAFLHVNEAGTKAMIEAAQKAGVLSHGHFIHISSLAAREKNMSAYAFSKHKAENLFLALEGNWSIVRPPAVYGPGDSETLKLFKTMKMGFVPVVGSRDNRFSLIHVMDLASGVLAIINNQHSFGQTFEISDKNTDGYTMANVADQVCSLMGWRVRYIPLPVSLLKSIGAVNELLAPLFGVIPILGREKARELAHNDWVSRTNLLNKSGLWSPEISVEDGLKETLHSYTKENLL